MGSKRALFSLALLLLLIGQATSDINQDKAECTNQLIAMSTCLPYVGGQSKAPTMDCCSSFKGVMEKSRRCICILIKDHDDPSLGFKINLNLALNLPNVCHRPSNTSECVDLLHLAPNSPEAKVFLEADKSLGKNSTTTHAGNGTAGGAAKETSVQNQSGAASWGGKSCNLLLADMLFGIFPFLFLSQFFIIL